MTRLSLHGGCLLLALLASACAGPVDASDGDMALLLGRGEPLTPLSDGESLDLVRGCQGLQHVFVAVRVEGVDPADGELAFTLEDPETEQVLGEVNYVGVPFLEVAGGYELTWLPLVVNEVVRDRLLSLRATFVAGTESSTTERSVLLVGGDGDGCG